MVEYAPNWQSKRRQTFAICDRCSMQPWRKAKVVHHLKYTRSRPRRLIEWLLFRHDWNESNIGYEIPGWDIVGVSEHCHENYYGASDKLYSVHFTGDKHTDPYWIKDGGLYNHQCHALALRLRVTFWAMAGGWIFLFFPAIAYFFLRVST